MKRQILAIVLSASPIMAVADDNRITTVVFGVVTHVRDGDTIEVLNIPIRLKGINADELGTDIGDLAKRNMELIAEDGGKFECHLTDEVSFDRRVGYCYDRYGYDVGAIQIKAGLAGRCERFDSWGRYAEIADTSVYDGPVPSYCEVRP